MAFTISVTPSAVGSTIILKNEATGCEAEVFSFGALLNKFCMPTAEGTLNVVDGFTNIEEACKEITNGFKSAFLSPFPCRMNHGEYTHEEVDYKVEKFYLQPHAIHGIVYDLTYSISEQTATDTMAKVVLSAHYDATDAGYPFQYQILHTYTLHNDNQLTLATSITNTGTSVIPYAQGWHPYFTLGESVDNCVLSFNTHVKVAFDDTLIPTGDLELEESYVEGKLLKDVFLDNCFEFIEGERQFYCELAGSKAVLTILPDNTYPFLQIYTPDHRQSIAIENLSSTPDCFNNAMGLQHIYPEGTANFSTTYQLTIR